MQGRTFVFWGDSLAHEEFASFVLMLLCHTDGATPYCSHKANQVGFPTLGAKVFYAKEMLLAQQTLKPGPQKGFYIDKDGNEHSMVRKAFTRTLDLNSLTLPDRIREEAAQPGRVVIINAGQWFYYTRSDVHFYGIKEPSKNWQQIARIGESVPRYGRTPSRCSSPRKRRNLARLLAQTGLVVTLPRPRAVDCAHLQCFEALSRSLAVFGRHWVRCEFLAWRPLR